MSVTIITLLLFGLLPRQARSQTAVVKGQNVTRVTVGNNNTAEAVFVKVGPKRWNHYYPDGKRLFTTHTETGRDEWSVYLTNGNLNMNVVINLFKKTITYFNTRSKKQTYTGKIMNAIGNNSTTPSNSNTSSNPNLSLEQQCYNAVQGKVAWSKGGSKTWGAANVAKLCKGTTNPAATIACFKREIQSHNSWSKGIDACKPKKTVVKVNRTPTTSNVAEVKFHSRNGLTLTQARTLAAQNGWELATPAQVTAAWQNRGLNAFAYGRTSDGKFCVPIQQNNGSFTRGANCGITGGNQGFLYVKKIPDVKFHSRANLTLAQAQNLAAQNGWQLATPAQVTAAWKDRGLNAFAYGRTSDGTFCVPIQQNNGSFKRGANCGVTGGNQGFLYVKRAAARNVAEVRFYPRDGITLVQARSLAAKYGWKLATPSQVAAAWKNRGLHAFAYGRTSDGKFCVPVQQLMGNFKIGANCGVAGGNQGFLYVNPSAPISTNKRSGIIDLTVGRGITGPPRAYGTKYAFRGLHTVWNKSVQHPAQRVFGLGDAVMLRKAAILMLRTQGRRISNASIDSVLVSLTRDATARFRFAPYLLKVTFEALATPRPDSGQLAFRKNFAAYMGLWRFEQSLDTLNRWNSYKRENERSQFDPNKYNNGPTAGNLLPMRPADVPRFLKSHNNPMLLGNKGRNAIRLLLDPAAAASLPEFRNGGLAKVGADMDAVAAGIGIGTTLATSAGTLALVSSAVLSGTVVGSVTTTAVTTAGATTVANTVPMYKLLLATGKLAGFSLNAAAFIGVAIAIAMAIVIGIAIARQAISDQLDRRLKREFERGFDPIDVYSMINDRDVSKRGLSRSTVFGFLLKMLIARPRR